MQSPHEFIPGCIYYPEATRALKYQRMIADERRQVWTDKHASVMQELQQAYALAGRGMVTGRRCYPLAVGVGKTQSIVAMLKAQAELIAQGQPALSVLICVERVEQMEQIRREALNSEIKGVPGVPPELIGMLHWKSPKECAEHGWSAPVENPDRYPFLICSHAKMMKGELSIRTVNVFNGRERSLVIWDEAILASRPLTLTVEDIKLARVRLECRADSRDATDAVSWVTNELNAVERYAQSSPSDTYSATITPEDETRYCVAIKDALRDDKLQQERKALLQFIANAGRPCRAVTYKEQGTKYGLIRFETMIPNELKRLIVLDASHVIRILCSELDPTVKAVALDCNVKRFDKVTVRWMKNGAGKSKMTAELRKGLKSNLVRDVVELVASYSANEPVLLVNFKDEPNTKGKAGVAYTDLLKDALRDAGMNLEETIKIPGEEKPQPRFNFITWGKHIATNEFRHCRHVVCLGVLRLAPFVIQGLMIAQTQDINTKHVSDEEMMSRVELSEILHNLVQVAGRGTCRHTEAGQAAAMSLSVICNDTIDPAAWDIAMPGVRLEDWKAKHAAKGKTQLSAVDAIIDALGQLPTSDTYIASRTLKKLAGLSAMTSNRYGEALRKADGKLDGWTYESSGRRYVRASPFGIAA